MRVGYICLTHKSPTSEKLVPLEVLFPHETTIFCWVPVYVTYHVSRLRFQTKLVCWSPGLSEMISQLRKQLNTHFTATSTEMFYLLNHSLQFLTCGMSKNKKRRRKSHRRKLKSRAEVKQHKETVTVKPVMVYSSISHRIHGNGIFTYIHEGLILMVNVGKYTSPMDPMGISIGSSWPLTKTLPFGSGVWPSTFTPVYLKVQDEYQC